MIVPLSYENARNLKKEEKYKRGSGLTLNQDEPTLRQLSGFTTVWEETYTK